MTLDEFFSGHEEAECIFEDLRNAIDSLGQVEMRLTKSQIAFRRRKAFAWAWMPGIYLRGEHAPLVLTIALRRRDSSPRWKEIVEPSPGRYTHHLELFSTGEIDDQVQFWL